MRDTRFRSRRGNSHVWPARAQKYACEARGTHLLPRIDSILVLGTLLPSPVTRSTLASFSPASVALRAEPTSSYTYALTSLSHPLDTSRDLNSFYFPYISRLITPSCHPPASYVSTNGFSSSFAPVVCVTFSQPSSNVMLTHPSISLPLFLVWFFLYFLSDIVTMFYP